MTGRRPVPFADLPPRERAFVDGLIARYIVDVGKPTGCSDEEMRRTMIRLIEQGDFVFVSHDHPDGLTFTLEPTEQGSRRWGSQ